MPSSPAPNPAGFPAGFPAPIPTAAQARYARPLAWLHAILALLIVGAFSVGVYMHELPLSPTRIKLYNWHKWAGVAILALSAARLLLRLALPAPAPAAGPLWQQRVAAATHVALYALFFAVPLLGWAYSSAAGFPIVWLGLWPLPDWVPVDKALADALKPWHARAAFALAALVLLHVGAALKHQLIDRDGLLARMSLR